MLYFESTLEPKYIQTNLQALNIHKSPNLFSLETSTNLNFFYKDCQWNY
jgi:hypothetical protein